MIYKLEKKVHDTDAEVFSSKTPGLINPEHYLLTHNRSKTYLVLFFSDSTKAQFYEMPCINSSDDEIETVMSFI